LDSLKSAFALLLLPLSSTFQHSRYLMPASKARQNGGGRKRAPTLKKARKVSGMGQGRQQKRIDLPYDVLLLSTSLYSFQTVTDTDLFG